jgi:hypothetical protein
MEINSFIKRFNQIKAMGFIPTQRRGNTGVGHTLEQLLGLTENNIALPDLDIAELKAGRRNATSMLTLFTKEPLSNLGRSRDKYLLNKFAYESLKEDRLKELYTTISVGEYNPQGFKLVVTDNEIRIVHRDVDIDIYWTAKLVQNAFEKKFPALVYVYADNMGEDSAEHFHYNEAILLKGFDFNGLMKAVKDGHVKVDLRMHMKNSGAPRNHGTAFRIIKNQIPYCFNEREVLVSR